ncbi:hypothetical protein GCM10010149_09580 [Nonomuraea roseoviolacea subsp. roseoviolacea]
MRRPAAPPGVRRPAAPPAAEEAGAGQDVGVPRSAGGPQLAWLTVDMLKSGTRTAGMTARVQ